MLFLINGFCNIVDIFKLIFESCFMFELFIEKVLESIFIVVCELLFLKIGQGRVVFLVMIVGVDVIVEYFFVLKIFVMLDLKGFFCFDIGMIIFCDFVDNLFCL